MALEVPIIGDQSIKKQFEEILEHISFGSTASSGAKAGNFDGEWLQATSHGTANTEFSVTHHLNRVPTGYLVAQRNKGGVIYNGSTAWTDALIYLKCTTTSTVFRMFVW